VRSETLSDKAYRALKDKIITLSSGTYLSARQFAEDIGMSYTPVREAFLRLQREGAIRQVPNVGFFVETMELPDLIQSYQVRECIEPFILDKVFDRITPEDIAAMKDIVKRQYESLLAKDIYRYMVLDIELHEVFFKIYNNKYMIDFYHKIREQRMICSNSIALSLSIDAIYEHEKLISAVETKNKDEALNCLLSNIRNSKQRTKDGYINVNE
jgi:GntR family transcriptional regulator, rspAB operon transcriptional repressor